MVLQPKEQQIAGCLVGTAIGDAIGLPYEALSRRRQLKLFPAIEGHRLFLSRGMTSDDTEHTCMVAQALIASNRDPDQFGKSLSWRLRFWLLGLPAGVGYATLRAILKSWMGFPPSRSGVWSAGNGPAMRAAIIGCACGGNMVQMRELVTVSSRLTHTDPRALHGALAVALAASMASRVSDAIVAADYGAALETMLASENAVELLPLILHAIRSSGNGDSALQFVEALGLDYGVSGFVNHTVPVVLHVWLRHQDDYAGGILEIIRCGGDTDTTAAILGGIIGARVGVAGIPQQWRSGLAEWPRNINWMERVAHQLAQSVSGNRDSRPVRIFFPAVFLRNLFFLLIILLHVIRRCLPPY